MNRKTMGLVICGLMVAALVLVSLALAEKPVLVKNSMGKMVEKPQYGGVLTLALTVDPGGFDDGYAHAATVYPAFLTNDELYVGDYRKGSQGTNEAGFMIQGTLFLEYSRPSLATGFEVVDGDTIIFHIRKGVHFQDRPPVNGRELNADDVVATLNRDFTFEKAYIARVFRPKERPLSITAPDKFTVKIKCAPGTLPNVLSRVIDMAQILSKDIIDKYGGQQDWRNVVGTGPFMMKKYVPNSSINLVRNPKYWDSDPLFPANKLPYLDGVDMVIIADTSTRIAGLRTGKIDWVKGVGWEDAASLHKTNPELKAKRFAEAAHQNVIWMRQDKPNLPFKDIRVRRALARGLDQKAIMDDYYGGNAVLLSTPVAPYPEFKRIYRTLDQYSQEVQKDYGYNPEEAKKLLAEAGYPKGFKTKILAWEKRVPLLSIVKAYWAQIGVDLEIDVREYGVYRSISYGGKHEEMVIQHLSSVAPARFLQYRIGNFQNFSKINDPTVEKVYDVIRTNIVMNDDAVYKAMYDWYPYEKEQCWYIETPSPIYEIIWQPWVKQYGGEWTVGYCNAHKFPIWVWIDQQMKKSKKG